MINRQIALTVIVLMSLLALFEFSGIDLWVQDSMYNFEQNRWVLARDNRVIKLIFYDGIKNVLILFALTILVGLVLFRKSGWIQLYRRGLLIVCISSFLVPLVIASMKHVTNTPCPNHTTLYGGSDPYVTVFTTYPEDFQQKEKALCYPAAHASGGFALLSLFFLFREKRNKILGLALGMTAGWSMGIYKMLIGDHFLSHTVVTMILAWLLILLVVKGIDRREATTGIRD